MKKKIFSLVLACCPIISSFGTVYAEENNTDVYKNNDVDISSASIARIVEDIKPAAVGYHKTETVVATENRNRVFSGYATDAWSKASSYNLHKGYSVSAGISFQGVGGTVGFSHSVATTIPANSSRYSKLAGYADITIKKVRIDYWVGGSKSGSSYRLDISYRNKYFDVVYK